MALVGLVSVALPPTVAAAGPQVIGSSLSVGGKLLPGQSLLSPHGTYRLDMQTDGNLVLRNSNCVPGSPGCPYALWGLGTWGQPGNFLVMQTDGNLVVYSPTKRAVWAIQSWGPSHVLRVQDNSNLVVYSGQRAVWSTGLATSYAHIPGRQVTDLTSTNGRYRFGTPGNSMDTWDLRIPGRLMWGVNCLHDPRVNCNVNGQLVLQGDGNLVWYQPGVHGGRVAEWSTGTWGMGPTNYLVMQDDGNLVLYDLWHRPLWNSMGFPVVRVH
jgi:hypothetical protein